MATYSGKPVTVNHPAEEVYTRISDLNSFQERMNALPEEARAQIGDVKFTADSIIINAPGVGEMKFNITKREPYSLVKLEAENSPVPFAIEMHLEPGGDSSTKVSTNLNVEIPAMLRPLIGSKMQEAADKFSELFTTLFAS
jgi:hypothetical protein